MLWARIQFSFKIFFFRWVGNIQQTFVCYLLFNVQSRASKFWSSHTFMNLLLDDNVCILLRCVFLAAKVSFETKHQQCTILSTSNQVSNFSFSQRKNATFPEDLNSTLPFTLLYFSNHIIYLVKNILSFIIVTLPYKTLPRYQSNLDC